MCGAAQWVVNEREAYRIQALKMNKLLIQVILSDENTLNEKRRN